MFFNQLPPELVDHVLSASSISFICINLWLTGDKLIQEKLAKGLKNLSLTAHPQLLLYCPQLVSQLRSLRSLSVKLGRTCYERDAERILAASPSIESLQIGTIESVRFLGDRTSSSSPINEEDFITALGTSFPLLRALSLQGPSLKPQALKSLPRSLTSLDAVVGIHGENIVPDNYNFYDDLELHEDPSSLEIVRNKLKHDWSMAPPQLIHISRILLPTSIGDASWLPRMLQSCEGLEAKFTDLNWTSTLPPELTSLSLKSLDYGAPSFKDCFCSLPTSLTILEICNNKGVTSEAAQLLTEALPSLPRSLTRLTLSPRTVIWETLESAQKAHRYRANPSKSFWFWPPHLECMELLKDVIEPSQYALLPPTLKTLVIYTGTTGQNGVEIDGQALGRAMPSLTSLTLNIVCYRAQTKITSDLPRSLTKLCLEDKALSATVMDDGQLRFLRGLSLTDLHLGLRHRIALSSPSRPFKLELPILQKLHMAQWHCEWFHLLPPLLTSLSIKELYGVVESQLSQEGKVLEGLPKSLVELDAHIKEHFQRPVDLPSQRLPQSLTILKLPDAVIFPSSMLREFPRGLKKVQISLSSIEEEDAPHIPPLIDQFLLLENDKAKAAFDWSKPYLAEHWPPRALAGLEKAPKETQLRVAKRLLQI